MTIREAVSTIDTVWNLRKKPLGWMILAAAVLVLGLAAWDIATAGVAWVDRVEKHVEDHEADKARLEWKVDVLREGQQQQGRDIRDIRNAVMHGKGRAHGARLGGGVHGAVSPGPALDVDRVGKVAKY